MDSHLDLLYQSAHPKHTLDLYIPHRPSRGLVIFIHGGAWRTSSSRDPTLADLPGHIIPADYTLAIPNYRLSDQPGEDVRYPAHLQDCWLAVEWLVRTGADGLIDPDTRKHVWLIGHSAGAHSISHFLLDSPNSPSIPPDIRSTFKGFFFSETIADIDALVHEYPDYQAWFITAAFGPGPTYLASSPANPLSPFTLPTSHPASSCQIVISHSKGDDLVSRAQSDAFHQRLVHFGLAPRLLADEDIGQHDQVLKERAFAQRIRRWLDGESSSSG